MRLDLAYFISIVNDWWDVMDSGVPNHRYSRNKSGLGVNWEQQEDSLKRMLGFPEGNNCQHKFGELFLFGLKFGWLSSSAPKALS